jgi:acyl-CoA dehydrogenase
MSAARGEPNAHEELTALVADLARAGAGPSGTLDPRWETFLELGLTAVCVPEELGGSGGGFGDEVVLVHEVARHGFTVPLVENLVASWALGLAGRDVTPRTRALAVAGDTAPAGAGAVRVAWGSAAEEVLVAWPATGAAELVTDPVCAGREVDLAGFPLDEIDLRESPRTPLPGVGVPRLLGRLGSLRSAQILGAATAVYERTVAHVHQREQFGRPLSAIPAVAASLAHMRTGLIQLERSVERAVAGADGGPQEQLAAAAAGRTLAGTVATDVAARGHQLHGAMGITAEYGLGELTRKLWSWRDADLPEREWAALLGRQARTRGEAALWDSLTGAA